MEKEEEYFKLIRKALINYKRAVMTFDEFILLLKTRELEFNQTIKEAKQEVFDDIEKIECLQICEVHNQALYLCDEYKKFKQRHLSTLQSKGTELSFKVPSQSSNKSCPYCEGRGHFLINEEKEEIDPCDECGGTGKIRL